ncbi:polysaccharide deacetylase [Halobacteriales archaeon QS_3_64_16]|nr:MAG: polysaccharide deacetylase [Halobacteriales archaeon QS_3_64_16]
MGSVVLSLDAELGWGFHDLESPPTARIERARTGWERLIECFEAFEVPATWAVVGHLFLEECDAEHAFHPAPEGWFASERGRWRSRPDLRFGEGLIEAIQDSAVAHEIGSHSYSHVVFGDRKTSRTLAAAELEESVSLARERDLSLESFVYPRNDVAHRDVLAEHGLTCYRGRAPARELDDVPGGRPLRKLREATIDAPPLVEPRRDEFGLVNVPASLYLFGFEGLGRSIAQSIWADPVVRGAKRGIDAAARREGVFHIWLHPNNIVAPRDLKRMETILAYLADQRDRGAVSIETMVEVAERVAAR